MFYLQEHQFTFILRCTDSIGLGSHSLIHKQFSVSMRNRVDSVSRHSRYHLDARRAAELRFEVPSQAMLAEIVTAICLKRLDRRSVLSSRQIGHSIGTLHFNRSRLPSLISFLEASLQILLNRFLPRPHSDGCNS